MDLSAKPSMKTIAQKAGVSVMTVSRALRNHPEINPDTRDMILKIAGDLGYSKNPLVSALMTQVRTGKSVEIPTTIAHVHCFPEGRTVRRNLINIREGIREQAGKLNFTVDEFYLNEAGMTPKRLLDILRARGICGIIFEHFFEYGMELDIDLDGFASVALNFTMTKPNLHRVAVPDSYSVQLGIRELEARGYEKIGLCLFEVSDTFTVLKREPIWLHYQRQLSEVRRVPALICGLDEIHDLFPKWMEEHQPDAILSNWEEDWEILRRLQPNQEERAGYVRLAWNEVDGAIGLTGIDPNWHQVGVSAVNLVVDAIYRGEFGVPENPTTMLVDPKWFEGETVRPVIQSLESEKVDQVQ